MDESTRNRILIISLLSISVIIMTGGIIYSINKGVTTPLEYTPKTLTVYFFYGEECPHCHNVMPVIQNLTKKYPNVDFQIKEIWHNQTNKEIAIKTLTGIGKEYSGVPVVVVGDTILLGDKEIPEKLEGIIINKTEGSKL